MRLTKAVVSELSAQSKDVFAWDDEVKGFGVRVKPSGRKTYVIRYRTNGGTSRYHTLCRCSDVELKHARDMAREAFVSVRQGQDPSRDRTQARAALTVRELYALWMKLYVPSQCKPSYMYVARGLFKNHIEPRIGGMKISEVTRADVTDIHIGLAEHPSTANSAISVLSSMYRLALDRELYGHNPAEKMKWFKVPKRSYVLSPEEIRRLLEALEHSSVFPQFRLLIRLLLLTGCRLREIMDARTEWIDWERRLLCLPDTKTGAREIALSESALELMAEAREREWLIPGRYQNHWKHVGRSWANVKELAGLPPKVRIHDLRHTVGSLSHKAGLSQKQIAIQLGHKRMSTTERYISGFRGEHHDIAEAVSKVVGG